MKLPKGILKKIFVNIEYVGQFYKTKQWFISIFEHDHSIFLLSNEQMEFEIAILQ